MLLLSYARTCKNDCNKRKIDSIFKRLMEMLVCYKESNISGHKKTESIKKEWINLDIKKKVELINYIEWNSNWWKYWTLCAKTFQTNPKLLNKLVFIGVTLMKASPIVKLKEYQGFINWLACGDIALNKKEYIKHVKQIYNGIAIPKSLLNRPPLVDYLFFSNNDRRVSMQVLTLNWFK